MLKKRLSRNLKVRRNSRQLTQERAAEICGISTRYWGRIEQGTANATIEIIEKISIGLDISAADLLQKGPDEEGTLQ